MDSSIPTRNYVGELQHLCAIHKINLPSYSDVSYEQSGCVSSFKFLCKVKHWTTEGVGFTKKVAKQNSAQEMITKIESENLISNLEVQKNDKNSISKLFEYCSKVLRNEFPLFGDKPNEDDLFIVTCQLKGFISEGRGSSRKAAKQMAADLCAKHFGVYQYFENLSKEVERAKNIKNPTQLLHELCQLKKEFCCFTELKIDLGQKKEGYIVICKVGNLEAKSSKNLSKKIAKLEAASLMVNLLNNETPVSSPLKTTLTDKSSDDDSSKVSDIDNCRVSEDANSKVSDEANSKISVDGDSEAIDEGVSKVIRPNCSDSDDDEPLVKRIKY